MTPDASGAVEVFVFQAGRFLGSRCFTQSTIVIGSGPEATLRLRDPSIIGRHAVLRAKGDSLVLASNHEAGGQVLINGEPISVRQVHSFDEVRIGPFRLKFTLLGGQAADDRGFAGEADAAPPTEPRQTRQRQPSGQPLAHHDPEDAPTTQHRAHESDEQWYGAPGSEFDEESVTRLRRGQKGQRARAASRPFDASAALGHSHAESPSAPRRERADELARSARQPSPPQRTSDYSAWLDEPAGADAPSMESPYGATTRARGGHDARASVGIDLEPPDTDRFASAHEAERDGFARGLPLEEGLAEVPGPYLGGDEVDEDEDEDEDENFVEPFSLLENIVRERFKEPTSTEAFSIIEVIRYSNGEIIDLMRADPGQSIRLAPDGFRLLRLRNDGTAELFFQASFSGSVVRGGKARPLNRLAQPSTLVNPREEVYALQLREGDYAQIVRDDASYLARFVRPPALPRPKDTFRLDLGQVQMFAGSAAFHFLVLVLLGIATPEPDLAAEEEQDRFAQFSLKDLKVEKPPEPPKPEEPPPADPEKPKDVEKPRPAPEVKPNVPVRRLRRPIPGAEERAREVQQQQQQKQVANVLTALQNVAPQGGPARSNLSSLVTNLKAVRAPAGAGSGFKIAGTIGKLPGNAIRLGGGGGLGGGKDTRIGSQLLAGGQIGSMKASASTGTRVLGRAGKAPTRAIGATGGILSREAIQKVVSAHMHKIQACYERALIANRNLAGKIVFDWVISPSGSVDSARQASSSLASAAVAGCILGEIRTWRFPKPVGGSVQVRYPFVFRVQGF